MMNFKKWIYSIALVLFFVTPNHAEKIVLEEDCCQVQQLKGNIFEISTFKNLEARIPTGNKLTYLKKSDFESFGYKIKPISGGLKTKIDDINKNGDKKGDKTESILDDLMIRSGYTKLDGKYVGNKGFDGIYIKGTTSNPIEIIIIESKQFRYRFGIADSVIEHVGLTLNQPNVTTGLPAQMSDDWIQNVANNLKNAGRLEISDMIIFNPKLINKYVSAVDTVRGEINILKLDNF
jgi:hypothetical protein